MNSSSLPTHDRQLSGDFRDSNGNSREIGNGNKHDRSHSPTSPKRKFSEAADSAKKAKRSKVQNACIYCRRSHMTCDQQRPCARCVKRDIGHLCHDEPREAPKRSKSELGVQEIAPAPEEGQAGIQAAELRQVVGGVEDVNGSGLQQVYAGARLGGLDGGMSLRMNAGGGQQQLAQPAPISPTHIQRHTSLNNNNSSTANPTTNPGIVPQTFDWSNSGLQNQFQDMHHLHPNYMFNTSEVTNEYNLLNDFLSSSLIDDGALYSNPDDVAQTLFSDPLLASSSLNALTNNASFAPAQQQQPPAPPLQPPAQNAKAGEEISRPGSAFPPTLSDAKAREKFYLTAADPAGLDSAG
ncbi:hypothetical protein B0A55_09478, partial [Friedmanniomyces simplex]